MSCVYVPKPSFRPSLQFSTEDLTLCISIVIFPPVLCVHSVLAREESVQALRQAPQQSPSIVSLRGPFIHLLARPGLSSADQPHLGGGGVLKVFAESVHLRRRCQPSTRLTDIYVVHALRRCATAGPWAQYLSQALYRDKLF